MVARPRQFHRCLLTIAGISVKWMTLCDLIPRRCAMTRSRHSGLCARVSRSPGAAGRRTVLGNHDRTRARTPSFAVVKDAGQVFVKNGVHVIDARGAALHSWNRRPHAWRATIRKTMTSRRRSGPPPPRTHSDPARASTWRFDGAALAAFRPRWPPIHGGQFYLPVIGCPRPADHEIRDGSLHSGHSHSTSVGESSSRLPLRVFVPPEIALFELRRT